MLNNELKKAALSFYVERLAAAKTEAQKYFYTRIINQLIKSF